MRTCSCRIVKRLAMAGLVSMCVLLQGAPVQAQRRKTEADSIRALLAQVKGEKRVDVFSDLCWHFRRQKPDEARRYGKSALDLARGLKYEAGEAEALRRLAVVDYIQGRYGEALEYCQQSLKLFEKLNDKNGIASVYNNIGVVHRYEENFPTAIEYYKKSLAIREQTGDYKGISAVYNNLGGVYDLMGDFETAISYHEKSLELDRKAGIASGTAASLNNLGLANYRKGNFDKAMTFFAEYLRVEKALNDPLGRAEVYSNMALLFLRKKQYNEAISYALQSMKLARQLDIKALVEENARTLSLCHAARNEYVKAYEFSAIHAAFKDSIHKHEVLKRMQSYEMQKRQAQIEKLEIQQKQAGIFYWSVGVAGVLILALLGMLIYAFQQKKRANEQLKQQNEAIIHQQHLLEGQNLKLNEAFHEIEFQNFRLEENLKYASRMQEAMLPSADKLSKYLKDHAELHRPRAIISGDFYWLYERKGELILSVVDCSGQGLSGAFMSMISYSLLTQLVADRGVTQADWILNLMHKGISKMLADVSPEGSNPFEQRVEMGVCVLNAARTSLDYAGALLPLYIAKPGEELQEIAPDRFAIAVEGGNEQSYFKRNTLAIAPGTWFYLCTDGFQNQLGGEKKHKFTASTLQRLLHAQATKPGEVQQQVWARTFDDWRMDIRQLDDVLILGFRPS